MKHHNNIYRVYCYEAECNTFTNKYASGAGFAMGTSVKKAIEEAKAIMNKTLNGWTPILGDIVVLKGSKVISCSSYYQTAKQVIETVKSYLKV